MAYLDQIYAGANTTPMMAAPSTPVPGTPIVDPRSLKPPMAPSPSAGGSFPGSAAPATVTGPFSGVAPTDAPASSAPASDAPANAAPSQAAHVNDPYLNRIVQLEQQRTAMHEPQMSDQKPLSFWDKLAAVSSAALVGYGSNNANEGIKAAEGWTDIPQTRYQAAEKAYQAKLSDIDKQIQEQGKLSDITSTEQERLATSARDRAASDDAAARLAEEKRRDNWEMNGGQETARVQAETKARQDNATTLRSAGYDERSIADYVATGTLKNPTPQTEVELALAQAKGDPTAAKALQILNQSKVDQINATHDPEARTGIFRDILNDRTTVRGEIAREIDTLQANAVASSSPEGQANLKALQKSLQGIDKDIEYINGELAKQLKLNLPSVSGTGTAPGPPTGKVWDPTRHAYVDAGGGGGQ